MNRGFYLKLALSNIKKNRKTYLPYLITCIVTVMMFYIMRSLSQNPGIGEMVGDRTLYTILSMGNMVVGLFSFIFLFYTNSFLMKNRKKEFGMFNILGMEKRHLAKVAFLESLIILVVSLSVGIIFGIALDKVMFLVIAKMIGADIPLGFFVSGAVIRTTILFFAVLFLLIFLKSVHMLRVNNPVELLRGGNVGEKEPKTRWIITVLGILGMATGYYLAITTKNPVASLHTFFIAVILVIISTYLLFTAGSIALLKLLRKRKSYYYQTRHFISVSGMIYRMKQNAVGLANICILSTMVLVMVSSTTSMMVGFEDILTTRYANDFTVYCDESENEQNANIIEAVRKVQKESNLPVENEIQYTYIDLTTVRDGSKFITDPEQVDSFTGLENMNIVIVFPLEDYNRIMGEHRTLKEGEIFLYSNRDDYKEPTLTLFDREYKVAGKLDKMYENGESASNIASTQYVVVNSMDEVKVLNNQLKKLDTNLGAGHKSMQFYYAFDTKADKNEQAAFYGQMKNELSALKYPIRTESREDNRSSMLGVYGGLFFLGIFMGVLFIMATVLIIYYKQISEGYEDRERFAIMQKVGLSKSEVRKAIRSQVLMVFFLPLIVAGIHLMAAFPLILKLLSLLNMTNTSLFMLCAVSCFAVFAVVYIAIYSLTARIYVKIVSGNN